MITTLSEKACFQSYKLTRDSTQSVMRASSTLRKYASTQPLVPHLGAPCLRYI